MFALSIRMKCYILITGGTNNATKRSVLNFGWMIYKVTRRNRRNRPVGEVFCGRVDQANWAFCYCGELEKQQFDGNQIKHLPFFYLKSLRKKNLFVSFA